MSSAEQPKLTKISSGVASRGPVKIAPAPVPHHFKKTQEGEDDDCPLYILVTTYLSYLMIAIFGHMRDFFGKLFFRESYKHLKNYDVSLNLNKFLFIDSYRATHHLRVILSRFIPAVCTIASEIVGIAQQPEFLAVPSKSLTGIAKMATLLSSLLEKPLKSLT